MFPVPEQIYRDLEKYAKYMFTKVISVRQPGTFYFAFIFFHGHCRTHKADAYQGQAGIYLSKHDVRKVAR
jgi:hypothetical protein